ncbi:aminotransferase class I/II-fold pyridoxal phosphate-dependent enzyme [uncultured Algibacter sp.]|uniref:DegT/DnrJ/EryC1/StrS family aminotransferase n=1 Tax=uncultured Algibacter sp. TaxID=298659 RepID=UPI00260A8137|nr:aminotransferase class I/II-fold pyridoxal phosphate-dependent enzyme [uncultured Algibacter sp.]
MLTKTKIYLSSPHMGGSEQKFVNEAFATNWIAPLGPNVNGFEADIKKYLGNNHHVAALSSGTSAIHLALQLLDVCKGDEVLCQSFTFSASANPIIYQGATPVFIDSESDTWNMSPELLEIAIKDRIEKYKKPKAIIAVHLYGMPYKANEINSIARKYNIPVVEDSAEALGSTYYNQKCGSLSDAGILSFNGNKIITTSGGGALVVKTQELKDKAVFLSTQARDNAPHYEHSSIGFNYRMSNVLAGIGRGQMEVLDDRVQARRNNFEFYKKNLSHFDGIKFLEEPDNFYSNRWITCIETESFEIREKIRLELLKDDIESRPLWKPMHMQPIFKDYLHFTNGTSENLFDKGLCLPSGSNLSQDDLDRILNNITNTLKL